MALDIKKVEYFNITVESTAAAGYQLLSEFADAGIGLFAFKAIPVGHGQMQFSLFPDDGLKMKDEAKRSGLNPDGPHAALIIKSDSDEPGECAGIFRKLSKIDIHVFEYNGIADIQDSYGVILYLKPEDCDKAIEVLKA